MFGVRHGKGDYFHRVIRTLWMRHWVDLRVPSACYARPRSNLRHCHDSAGMSANKTEQKYEVTLRLIKAAKPKIMILKLYQYYFTMLQRYFQECMLYCTCIHIIFAYVQSRF